MIDSRDKRSSAILGPPVYPLADGSINAGDRAHMVIYRGIALDVGGPVFRVTGTDLLQIPVDYQIAEEKVIDSSKIKVVRHE